MILKRFHNDYGFAGQQYLQPSSGLDHANLMQFAVTSLKTKWCHVKQITHFFITICCTHEIT